MGRNAVDAVRRLTLALLLAAVAALGASVDDVPVDDVHVEAAAVPRPLRAAPRHIGTTMTYGERRCSERALTGTPVSLVDLVRHP